MADHLTRLAARALGQAPGPGWAPLAPRLPSRFESDLDGPELLDGPEQSEEEVTGAEPGGEPAGGDTPRAGRDRAGTPASAEPRQHDRAAWPVGRQPPTAGIPRELAEPAAVRPGPQVRIEHVTAAPASVHTGQDAVREGPARAATPPRTPVTPVVPPPVPVPVIRPAQREPVVRISIGRIEVRAVPAPATPPPAAPAPAAPPPPAAARPAEPAVLTLSAYLRGDRGRGA